MITLNDWDEHCRGEKPLFYGMAGKVWDIPKSIPVAFDRNLECWCLMMPSGHVSFDDIFETRKECAEHLIAELNKEYCI